MALLGFGFLLGFAGASFAVGVPFVNAWYPPERQGFALGIYGIGMGGTVLAAIAMPASLDVPFWIALRRLVIARRALRVHALTGCAGARTRPAAAARGPFREVQRRLAPGQLTLFYFMAFGGFVAMFLYLPKLLTTGTTSADRRRLARRRVRAARPVGPPDRRLAVGQHRRRERPDRLLRRNRRSTRRALLAGARTSMVPLTIACLTMAVCLGLGTGAVFKLVPQWYPDRVGAVTGVVGAAGGLGGFFPPLVMGIVNDATGTYTMAFVFLVAFAWMSAGLALSMRAGKATPGLAAVEPAGTGPVEAPPANPGRGTVGARS